MVAAVAPVAEILVNPPVFAAKSPWLINRQTVLIVFALSQKILSPIKGTHYSELPNSVFVIDLTKLVSPAQRPDYESPKVEITPH